MSKLNIAIVGSGISGLSAAWLLSKRHNVTVYEAGSYAGGHANTVDVQTPSGVTAVDTGFIVYNERNYPNLVALFEHLGVETSETEMSFSFTFDQGKYEYAGSGAKGFFGQRRNLARVSHWKLLAEISRFFRTAQSRMLFYQDGINLGAFLREEGYSEKFIVDHIVPMGAAIWSTSMIKMREFPAQSFINFYANHGLLQFKDRPLWRSVCGGSKNYVKKLIDDGDFEILLDTPVVRVDRGASEVKITDASSNVRCFDHVVIATHADQALNILTDSDAIEGNLLGGFAYQKNIAVLHRDPSLMPRRRTLWSSWNYIKNGEGLEAELSLTYWMNRLQSLNADTNFFVTLNPKMDIHEKAIDAVIEYDHPVFSSSAMDRQKHLWSLQGRKRTWFCGSYFGFGFHEDGAQSGFAMAEMLGGVRRPWNVDNESGRITIAPTPIAEAAE